MSSHPSVTTYQINGPPNSSAGSLSQDSRGGSSPGPQHRQRPSKLSRIPSSDQGTATQSTYMMRNPMPSAYSQPSRSRAYSNDRPPQQQRQYADNYGQTGSSGRASDRVLPTIPGSGLWSIIERLPQPVADQTVISLAQQVFLLADNFVDNHYGDRLGQTVGSDHRYKAMAFPYLDNGTRPADVLFLIEHPTIAIKHCIIYLLLSCISFDDGGGSLPSLLPHEFTVTASALSRSSNQSDSPEQFAALSAYRVLLSYLRTDVYYDSEYQNHLGQAKLEIRTFIETAFDPWREPHSTETTRTAALTALIDKTAQLGILLFSQPCTFQFVWVPKASTAGDLDIEVCPRLLKINDEQARDLNPSQMMLAVKVQRTRYIEDTNMQDYLLRERKSNGIVIYPDDSGPYQNLHSTMNQPTGPKFQSVHTNFAPHVPAQGSYENQTAIELSADPVSQLPSPERHLSFSQEPEELQTSDVQHARRASLDYPSNHERQPEMKNNGMPRSPPGNGATHNAFSQQMDQRRKNAPRPPPASIQQFPANQSPTRRRSSRRHSSSRASSEDRGRSQSISLSVPQRRASVSNDRTAAIEYGHRVPSDVGVLQSPISPNEVRGQHNIIDDAIPSNRKTSISLYRRITGDQSQGPVQTGSSPPESNLAEKTLRGQPKKRHKLKKFFGSKT